MNHYIYNIRVIVVFSFFNFSTFNRYFKFWHEIAFENSESHSIFFSEIPVDVRTFVLIWSWISWFKQIIKSLKNKKLFIYRYELRRTFFSQNNVFFLLNYLFRKILNQDFKKQGRIKKMRVIFLCKICYVFFIKFMWKYYLFWKFQIILFFKYLHILFC